MSTTDIKALVAEGKKAALSAAHDDCLLLSDLVDALERQQAVVRVLRSMDRRGLLGKELRDALAAVDAAPEGDG